ncbi:hypothetical protein [uncultured Roseobacter sp.]|uniref:hypothetical protein n=1 Tax=uncultured Roseobacter sp. TaxID=114847 RepID=UPI00262ADFB7|nr:hypothetical protein [uncultured Roseobacter sp.]
MPGRKITQKQIDQIAKFRERGWSVARIAEHMGISRGAVDWNCLKFGIESPKTEALVAGEYNGPMVCKRGNHVVRRFTKEEDVILMDMVEKGARLVDIGQRLGRPGNSIGGHLMTLARRDERQLARDTGGQ